MANKQLRRLAVVFVLLALATAFGKAGNPGHGVGSGNGHPQTGLWEGPL